MKKFADTFFGTLGGIGFLYFAMVIFVWDIGQLQRARDSRDWPRVEGRVTRSTVAHHCRETTPLVVYTWTVAGTSYTSSQISFDLFDKPGGQGRIESILARYPLGEKVTVYYDPNEPGAAILEPGVYSPFFMPLVFAALFFFFGSWILWRLLRLVVDGRPVPPTVTTPPRPIVIVGALSGMIYGVFVLVSMNSVVRDTFVKALGERPAGIPNLLFVLALQTLLYLPIPWVFWHGLRLTSQAMQDSRRVGYIGYVLSVGDSHPHSRRWEMVCLGLPMYLVLYLLMAAGPHPHLRRSQVVCIGGLVYMVVLVGTWIAYSAACGI